MMPSCRAERSAIWTRFELVAWGGHVDEHNGRNPDRGGGQTGDGDDDHEQSLDHGAARWSCRLSSIMSAVVSLRCNRASSAGFC